MELRLQDAPSRGFHSWFRGQLFLMEALDFFPRNAKILAHRAPVCGKRPSVSLMR